MVIPFKVPLTKSPTVPAVLPAVKFTELPTTESTPPIALLERVQE